MQQNKDTIYARYCRMGRKVELSGAVTLAAAVAGHMISGGNAFLSVLGGIGLLILAFAQQLTNTPDRDFAQGLLEAMEKNGKTLLSGRAIANLHQAIYMYEKSKDADAVLVEKLRAAAEKHVRKMPF